MTDEADICRRRTELIANHNAPVCAQLLRTTAISMTVDSTDIAVCYKRLLCYGRWDVETSIRESSTLYRNMKFVFLLLFVLCWPLASFAAAGTKIPAAAQSKSIRYTQQFFFLYEHGVSRPQIDRTFDLRPFACSGGILDIFLKKALRVYKSAKFTFFREVSYR